MHILIHLFEAFVSLFLAYIYIQEDKKYVQYVFMVASIGFFIATYISLIKTKKRSGLI